MKRLMLFLSALSAATAAAAQSSSPQIAFVKSGQRGDEIWFVNPDATGLTKFYPVGKNAASGRIERIAILPGGGEVAWIEDNTRIRVQAHDSLGRPVGTPRQVAIANHCLQGDLDYHRDGRLVISDGCWGISVVQPGGTTAVNHAISYQNVSAVRWMNDGSILWQEGELDAMRLVRRAPDGTETRIGPVNEFPMPHYGIAPTSEEAAISTTQSFKIYNLVNGNSQPGCKLAGLVQFSPDGNQIAYRSPGGIYSHSTLFVQKKDCSGAPFRLMAKGAYRTLIWRKN